MGCLKRLKSAIMGDEGRFVWVSTSARVQPKPDEIALL